MATVIGGRYEVKARLGKGGMATIYGAEDTRLRRPVAIKVLDATMVSARGLRMFSREARAIAALRHNHIVQLYDYSGPDESPPYIVMELVDGLDLDTVIEKYSPLPEPVILTILARVASALAHAHERGVIHRDLKPGNVMLERAGRVLLTDFGIAKDWADPTRFNTVAGTHTAIVGTPAFMAPEQLVEQEPVGPGADIFSLGSLAYCMATGASPFEAGNPALVEVLRRVVDTEFEDPLKMRSDLSRDLGLQIDTCLQRDPDGRPTAEEVEELCNLWLHQRDVQVPEQMIATLLDGEGQTVTELHLDTALVVVDVRAPGGGATVGAPSAAEPCASPAVRPRRKVGPADATAMLDLDEPGSDNPRQNVAPVPAQPSPGFGRKRQKLAPEQLITGARTSRPAGQSEAAPRTDTPSRPAPAPRSWSARRIVAWTGIAALVVVAVAAAVWFAWSGRG